MARSKLTYKVIYYVWLTPVMSVAFKKKYKINNSLSSNTSKQQLSRLKKKRRKIGLWTLRWGRIPYQRFFLTLTRHQCVNFHKNKHAKWRYCTCKFTHQEEPSSLSPATLPR